MNRIAIASVLFFAMVLSSSLFAQKDKDEKAETIIENAAEVFEDITEIPEESVPPTLLDQAEGIAIIPKVIKGGFVVGGRHGKGIAMVRKEDGSWSNPVFINLTGGSVGFQIGVQSIDVFLVFKERSFIENMRNSTFTLGADASVAAGPVGRQTSASTDYKFEAEIYSYSQTKGFFAGVSLDGSSMKVNEDLNEAYYSDKRITIEDILTSEVKSDKDLDYLREELNAYTP